MKSDKKIITAQIDGEVYDILKEISTNNYTTISSVVRKIVSSYCLLNSSEGDNLDAKENSRDN